MKQTCKYQAELSEESCVCMSSKIIHTGTVPLFICKTCPYRKEPDFFSATEQLWNRQQQTGEYKPVSKPCGGCNKTEALQPAEVPNRAAIEPDGTTQFIWCYWHAGAKSDELRWSMRSVEQNFQGRASFLVIGDRPPWYDGPWIQQPRIQTDSKGFTRGLRDVLAKMETLSRHPDVAESFVWMMDDVFLTKPVALAELQIPRHAGPIKDSKRNRWQKIKTNTRNRLLRNGFPGNDYATHAPHFAEKAKLRELFQTWNPLGHIFLWEVAYQNTFAGERAQQSVNWLSRTRKQYSEEWYRNAKPILNVCANGWGETIRNALVNMFPDEHTGEMGMKPRAAIRIKPEPVKDHWLLIQSAYRDEQLSSYRLEISEHTSLQALAAQTRQPKVKLAVHAFDPHKHARIAAFAAVCEHLEVLELDYAISERSVYGVDWQLPEGRNLVSRIDDDDIISRDFCEITRLSADRCIYQFAVLDWPCGYVWHRGKLHRLRAPGNQFISVVADGGQNPHMSPHKSLHSAWPAVTVEQSRGWVWVRHRQTITDTRPKYLAQSGGKPNLRRWPVDITSKKLLEGKVNADAR